MLSILGALVMIAKIVTEEEDEEITDTISVDEVSSTSGPPDDSRRDGAQTSKSFVLLSPMMTHAQRGFQGHDSMISTSISIWTNSSLTQDMSDEQRASLAIPMQRETLRHFKSWNVTALQHATQAHPDLATSLATFQEAADACIDVLTDIHLYWVTTTGWKKDGGEKGGPAR